jgi:large conductance mechanosensitive channel
MKGFKAFLMRGNVVDLAVGVIIGAAFGDVVKSLVESVFNPFLALLVGKPDFRAMIFEIGGTKFPIGDLITQIVRFVLVAAAIYFFVVLPISKLEERRKRGEVPPDPTTKKCPECISEIPIAAKRCAFCTSPVA